VLADAPAAANFTIVPQLIVLANATSFTVLALAPFPLVLADAPAAANFTPVPPQLVLAKTMGGAVLALAPLPQMLTKTMRGAVLAVMFFLITWAFPANTLLF